MLLAVLLRGVCYDRVRVCVCVCVVAYSAVQCPLSVGAAQNLWASLLVRSELSSLLADSKRKIQRGKVLRVKWKNEGRSVISCARWILCIAPMGSDSGPGDSDGMHYNIRQRKCGSVSAELAIRIRETLPELASVSVRWDRTEWNRRDTDDHRAVLGHPLLLLSLLQPSEARFQVHLGWVEHVFFFTSAHSCWARSPIGCAKNYV